ncbi:MAG TPA: ArgR family transcriptional regulator [Spirochaetia bacterium]|nr:ArgR family transcriptional regulator [Spirochaetia bacterium]
MNDRSARLRVIRRLIKNERVESQELLLGRLEREGYTLTQATLSRDLKLLKVGKVSDGASSYYVLPDDEAHKETVKNYVRDVKRGWVSIDFSGNIAVVSTLSGHANSVAFALDRMELPEILGSVAGDDTVILVIREGLQSEHVRESLRERFPGLEI